jgi:putative OPT family oligopeptide transporter
MLFGAILAWGVAVPVLTAWSPMPAGGDIASYATGIWVHEVRFMGAGLIGVAAIWALIGLIGPTWRGIRDSFVNALPGEAGTTIPETDRDLPGAWTLALFGASLLVMAVVFWLFLRDAPGLTGTSTLALILDGLVFAALFGFIMAAACGYMAGLVGSSSSPISGIAILGTILASLLLLLAAPAGLMTTAAGRQSLLAFALFAVTGVLATATVSNDNLQDLKTGLLVGASPWRQQVALVVGCLVGAAVIPPVLELLYNAYGFAGALPRPGMDPLSALAAPQATVMAAIARGIFGHSLDWRFIAIGATASVVLILMDSVLQKLGARVRIPTLAVGIGLYLPPTVGVTLALGAILGWFLDRALHGQPSAAQAQRRGVLIASGFIVGESLVGVLMAGIIGFSGSQAPLALVGPGFAPAASWLGLAAFATAAAWFARRTLSTSR